MIGREIIWGTIFILFHISFTDVKLRKIIFPFYDLCHVLKINTPAGSIPLTQPELFHLSAFLITASVSVESTEVWFSPL